MPATVPSVCKTEKMDREIIVATVKENVSLSAFDAVTGGTIAVVPVGTKDVSKPHEIALSRDGKKAFVSLYGDKDYGPNTPDNRIGVVNLTDFSFAGHIDLDLYKGPHAMWAAPDGMIWVTVDPNRCVLLIDPDSWEIEKTLFLEVPGHFSAASADEGYIYFSAKEYPVVVEVDVSRREITRRFQVPVGAQAVRVSADGKCLYVGDFNRPLLHIIDLASGELSGTFALTGVPGWPFNSRNGEQLIVTTYDEPADRGYVELLKVSNLNERRGIELPAEPFHALPMKDGIYALVALANGDIAKIDLVNACLTDGGFSAGGSMPETLLYLE